MTRLARIPRSRPATAACCLAMALAGAGAAGPDLALAPNVRDPIFAMLVDYVRTDRFGVVTREEIARTLERRRLASRLPWQGARDFERAPGPPGTSAALTLRFERPVDVSIPFRILWYQPGRIHASATARFREWRLAQLAFETQSQGKPAVKGSLADVRLYSLDEGRLLLDVDGWLDALFGGALDDTWIDCLALGRLRGREYGFAVGRNTEGRSRIGAFDLTRSAVAFPMSDELRAANHSVRREYERRIGASASR